MRTITTFLLLPATATKLEHQTSATPNALQHQPDLVYLQYHLALDAKRGLRNASLSDSVPSRSRFGSGPHSSTYQSQSQLLEDSPTPSSPCPESDHDDYFEFQAHSEDARASFADFQWPASDTEDSSGLRTQSPVFFPDSDDDGFFGALTVNDGAANDSSDDEAASTDGAPNDEFYVDDIALDPLFRTQASIFNAENTVEEEDSIPLAFDDHPAIRHAYIRAFVGSTFKGMTRDAVSNMLEGTYTLLRSPAASGTDFPGLSNFSRTLPTVEKRLGVLTDEIIIYLFLCDACWKPHYLQELSKLKTPHCDQPECSGTLYTVKRLSGGTEKEDPRSDSPLCPSGECTVFLERLCKNILYKNGMINAQGTQKIEKFFRTLIWPTSISHLPPSVGRGAVLVLQVSALLMTFIQLSIQIRACPWRVHGLHHFHSSFTSSAGAFPCIDANLSPIAS
ncbi:Transposase family Tnp2 protein [Mycena venus]|uniref:Transposase family Tnp2 protein n=1 Tax=Mycena venus TaxID=2733690 RepID=A0A8H6ZAE1_9AGAR|nr:Transposase family Tnp2 protein [Mycena venus]